MTAVEGTFRPPADVPRTPLLSPQTADEASPETVTLPSDPEMLADVLRSTAGERGVAIGHLDDPLPVDQFVTLGHLLGEPYPETAPDVLPYVTRDVVLNLTATEDATAATSLQPFSQAPLRLHSESSGSAIARQPRYICLMCLHPGDPGAARTVTVDMRSVHDALDPSARQILARTSYTLPDAPPVLRWESGHPVFAFRDFGDDPLAWRSTAGCAPEQVNDALADLTRAMYAGPSDGVVWQRGLVVLIDNRRVFHGRTAGRGSVAARARHLRRLRILEPRR